MRYANLNGPLEREAARHAILDQIGRGIDNRGAADNQQQFPPHDELLLDDDEREELRQLGQQDHHQFQLRIQNEQQHLNPGAQVPLQQQQQLQIDQQQMERQERESNNQYRNNI